MQITHIRLGVLPGGVDVAFNSLPFQATEDRLGICIVLTVFPAARTENQAVAFALTI